MPSSPLADLAARYWQFQREEFPIIAINAGDPPDSDILMREAPADYERRAVWASNALKELEAISIHGLSAQEKASRALLASELAEMVQIVETQGYLRPSIYPLGPEFMLTYWANSTGLTNVEAARRYVARLAHIPAALEQIQAAMTLGASRGIRYPKLVVDRALGVVRGQAGVAAERAPFFRPLAAIALRGEAYAGLVAEGRTLIAEKVLPAFAAYADFIERVLLPAARDDIAVTQDVDGDKHYRLLIRQATTTDMTADEIHALGLSEVERITREMLEVAASAGFEGDLAGFKRRIQTDNQQILESAEALRQEIEILSKRIDGMIPRFYGHLPRTTYGVSLIPEEISAALPPAYAQPNPADNSASGVHWITSLPAKLPRYMHIPLALHEAWPGHLMHLALIQELKDLPAFRRNGGMRYSVCLEGWALYSEAMGEDMGLYDTPEKIYGRLEMEMWRAVRLVVDTGIHAKGWSRDQAIAYFQEHMVMPIETVEAEVDRYVGLPGQALAYQIGNLKFRELRRRSEAALGDRFDIRKFHDALVSQGAVTLEVLEQTIDDWIESEGRQAA